MAILSSKRKKVHYPIKDPLDRVTSMTSPAGTTNYHYDTTTGLLDKITSPEGKQFTFAYNHGQLQNMQYPNGINASYSFDQNGNLQGLHYDKNGSPLKRYDYSYDKDNMRTGVFDNEGLHSYEYDPLYQITKATNPTIQNPLEQFTYDAAGNRLTDNIKSAYQYNDLNQLTEDDSTLFSYDADGNMIQKISKNTSDTATFTYDVENKLVQVSKAGLLVKYTYDALGRRMRKEVNGVATQFRYDGNDMILETNDNDSITADYTFGPGIDNPLQMHRNSKNYYYVKDGLGSVTALTDSNANVVKEYKYSVYGVITDETGDTAVWNPFTYTSREREKELGIYFYRARFYDPQIGRFLNEDPLGLRSGDYNLYRYVGNCPIYYVDPSGNIYAEVLAVGAVIVGSVGVRTGNLYVVGAGLALLGAAFIVAPIEGVDIGKEVKDNIQNMINNYYKKNFNEFDESNPPCK